MKRLTLLVLIILISFVQLATADTLDPTDDAYTASWSPSSNFDGGDLQCYKSGSTEAWIWILFDLPGAVVGETWIYDGAHLLLYIYDCYNGQSSSAYVYDVSGPWQEESITHGSKPGLGPESGYSTATQGQWWDYNATYFLREWYSYGSLTNYGFCIKLLANERGFWAYDREDYHTNERPYLVVDYVVVTPSHFDLSEPVNGREFIVYASKGNQKALNSTNSSELAASFEPPTAQTIDFEWGASATDGPGTISYRLQVDDNSDFSSPVLDVDGITTNSYNHEFDFTEDDTYYWRVTAIESQLDVETECNNVFTFGVLMSIEDTTWGQIKALDN